MIGEIWLTEAEQRIGTWVGKQRYANAERFRRAPGLGPSSRTSNPDLHIRGSLCEMAASFGLNLYWRPQIGEIRRPDVGGCVEVRSTVRADGSLAIKPEDEAYPFVLVRQLSDNHYCLLGWLHADEAKRFPLVRGPSTDPLHFVPQRSLLPIDELLVLIRAKTP